MIRPLIIPQAQNAVIGVLESLGYQLLGFVEHKDDYRIQEAVMKRNGVFKRVLPSGAVRVNKRWNWRTDQDLTIIYPEWSPIVAVDGRERSRRVMNYLKMVKMTNKKYNYVHN